MSGIARLIASGLGSGYAPRAPGTAGSALALATGAGLMLLSGWVLPAAVLAATLVGLWSIGAAGVGADRAHDDPGWVVVDEIAGQWLALIGLARPTLSGLAAAFLLFRLFDIVKPGPVGWADRQSGAAGIMADDLAAGALAAGVLWAVREHWPWVFG